MISTSTVSHTGTSTDPDVIHHLVLTPKMIFLSNVGKKVHRILYVLILPLTVYFVCKVIRSKGIHANFRLVMSCAAFAFASLSGTHIFVHVLIEQTEDVRPRYALNMLCLVASTVHMLSLVMSAMCMNMLTVEQHLATVWVRIYEEKKIRVGFILMFMVLAQSIPFGVFINWFFLRDNYDMYYSTTTCIPVDEHWEIMVFTFTASFLSCLICSVWITFLRRFNNKRTKDRLQLPSLSARYQQTCNSIMNGSIVPSLFGYMVMSIAGLMLCALRKYTVDLYGDPNPYGDLITDMGYVVIDLYAFYHMFCFTYYNESMRRMVARDLRICRLQRVDDSRELLSRTSNSMDTSAITAVYFSQLMSSWE